jgi:hypothetical protein
MDLIQFSRLGSYQLLSDGASVHYFFTFEVRGVKPITTAGAAENQRKQAVFIRKNDLLNCRISFIAAPEHNAKKMLRELKLRLSS